MSVFDAASSANGGNVDSLSWTHTPVGTPSGVGVSIPFVTTNAVTITGVTYGGVALALKKAEAADSARFNEVWGKAGIPAGAQTVFVTFSGTLSHGAVATAITATGGATSGEVFDMPLPSAVATSTVLGVSVTSAADQFVMDSVVVQQNVTITKAAPQTERTNFAITSGQGAVSTLPGAAASGMEWTCGTAVVHSIIAAVFANAGAPGPLALGSLSLGMTGHLGLAASVTIGEKNWRIPTNAADGTSRYVFIVADDRSALLDGALCVASGGFYLFPASAPNQALALGSKREAFVSNRTVAPAVVTTLRNTGGIAEIV